MNHATALEIGVTLESMLLAPVLRPVFGATESLGEYGLDAMTRAIAGRDSGGFAALVAASIESMA